MCIGDKPDTPGPTAQERALAKRAAREWNDYVDRYIPLENEFIERTKATDDVVASLRGAANADTNMAYGEAERNARREPGSGRDTAGVMRRATARDKASGLAQAFSQQAAHDREQKARVKISAFGRGLADQSTMSLGSQASRATEAALQEFEQDVARDNQLTQAALYGLGAGFPAIKKNFDTASAYGTTPFSQQANMLQAQERGLTW